MNEANLASMTSPYPVPPTLSERVAALENHAWQTISDLQSRVNYLEDQLGISAYPKPVAVAGNLAQAMQRGMGQVGGAFTAR